MINPVMFVLVLVLVLVVASRAEQRFAEIPPSYLEVAAGDEVQLRCKVHDKKGDCIWQKNRRPVGMFSNKYEWVSRRDGDCTLLIRNAQLDLDDADWECQVTPGDLNQQDSLTSPPARLLVRVKPRMPVLMFGEGPLTGALTMREGHETTISCVSRYGNPPAHIKWFIGDQEVNSYGEQTNSTEIDNQKTWYARSYLQVRGTRENHNQPIKCLAVHPTTPEPLVAETRLNVHYAPMVRLETIPRGQGTNLEDSASFISLKCISESNPAASIEWYKDDLKLMASPIERRNGTTVESEIKFEPIKREDAGLYSCKASNSAGLSINHAAHKLDVMYGPKLRLSATNMASDEVEETTQLGTSLIEAFECPEFEANPPPYYRWMHLQGDIMQTIEHSGQNRRKLLLRNIKWSDEGMYRCVAYNIINGVRRELSSDTRFVLHVTGPPEIQTRPSLGENGIYESISYAGESAHRLKSRFCSRPPPRLVAWQWGSSYIRAGETLHQKYEALALEPIVENKVLTNCYWAKLEIKNIQKSDARVYTLVVESEKGKDSTNLKLVVRDPTEMRLIAAAAAVALLVLIVLISAGMYSLMRAKHRRYRREEEEGSINADAFYNSNSNTVDRQKSSIQQSSIAKSNIARKVSAEGGLAVMYNYDQVTKQRTMSPEALEVRRAPAVLQPPTIV